MFNAQNGAARALESVGRELAALLAKRPPDAPGCLFSLGGTFVWRNIAGTNRLSRIPGGRPLTSTPGMEPIGEAEKQPARKWRPCATTIPRRLSNYSKSTALSGVASGRISI